MILRPLRSAFFILALFCAACGVSAPPASSLATETPTPLTLPTLTPRPVAPSPSASPTLPPAPRQFTEDFDAEPVHWTALDVDNGRPFSGPTLRDGFLVFDLVEANQWAYSLYAVPDYADVTVSAQTQMRTEGTGAVGVVCRYAEHKGWYEFNIHEDQTYQLLFGQWLAPGVARYTPLFQGDSEKIAPDANNIGLECRGNTLTPFINGVQMRRWQEKKFGLQSGQVGLSASSFADIPFTIAFDSIAVSEP